MRFDLRCFYSPRLHIAVTGGTGYIGNRIIQEAGISDCSRVLIEEIPSGAVILHFSADLSQTRESVGENIDRDLWLVEQANAKHGGLIYASGNNVYPYALDCRVEDKLRCNDYYSASKVLGEHLISDFIRVPYCALRIADVFGVGQRHGNLFRAIEQALSQQTSLKKYGQGLKRRSYIEVKELALFSLFLAKKILNKDSVPPIINVCYPETPTVGELIDKIAELSHLPIEQVVVEQDNSSLDVRTMHPGPFMDYQFHYASLDKAIEAYIKEIQLK